MIRIALFSRGKTELLPLTDLARAKARLVLENAVLWVDISNPTTEENSVLTDYFGFHPLAIADCQRTSRSGRNEHHPKVEDFRDYLFVIFNPIQLGSASNQDDTTKLTTHQLSSFIGKDYLVTHHDHHISIIDEMFVRCGSNIQILARGSDYVYQMIVDQIVDNYSPILEHFDKILDDIEERIFNDFLSVKLSEIITMKKKILRFRNIMFHQREIMNRLSRGEFQLISDNEAVYYRNVYDHLVRMTDLAESYRDVVSSLLDAYLSVNSNRMNQVMKVLTIISTIFLPLTFLSSIYGMNFKNMPELEISWAYYFLLVVFFTIGLGMFLWIRSKGWLEN